MSFYDDHKQLIDQSAHTAVGLVVTVAIGYFLGPMVGALTTMAGALLRELSQHDWDPFDFKGGTALDLGFFAVGAALGVVGLVMFA